MYHAYYVCTLKGAALMLRYFVPTTSEARVDMEAEVMGSTLALWAEASEACGYASLPSGLQVVFQQRFDMMHLLVMDEDTDPTTAEADMVLLTDVISAVCDGRPSDARLTSFHGKACAALAETLHRGEVFCRDVQLTLRVAKLKHPK